LEESSSTASCSGESRAILLCLQLRISHEPRTPGCVDNVIRAIFVVVIERVDVVDWGTWSRRCRRRWRQSSLFAAGAAHRSKVGGYGGGCAAARVCVGGNEMSARPLYICRRQHRDVARLASP
jgi:hypothetical protein